MSTVSVKNVCFGKGIPKICVPIASHNLDELLKEVNIVKALPLDLVEWRVDFFEGVKNAGKVQEAVAELLSVLGDIPLLFTIRSKKEGGFCDISQDYYFELNRKIAQNTNVDLLDIELFNEESSIREVVEIAHHMNKKIIISSHDFHKTPSRDEMIRQLCRMERFGADILKLAVTPTHPLDVLKLLKTSIIAKEKWIQKPLITTSMGPLGTITRISGEFFASDMTFAYGENKTAPGQISAVELRNILNLLHPTE